MSNIIKERIADFLKEHPPFSFISRNELLNIASHIVVEYIEKDRILFNQGEPASERFYVVHEGAIELTNTVQGKEVLTDICDEGDIFGIRSIIAQDQNYTLTVQAAEESLIYSVPAGSFRELLNKNNRVKDFFDTVF